MVGGIIQLIHEILALRLKPPWRPSPILTTLDEALLEALLVLYLLLTLN